MSRPSAFISLSEINRVAPWSLRALGYPFGTAERATRLLVWSEAAVGGGLAILSAGAEAIRAANKVGLSERTQAEDGCYKITAQGRCLFDLGPVLVDLATARARLAGTGAASAGGVTGMRLTAALSELGVKRGLHVLVAFAAGAQDFAPGSLPVGWILGSPGPDGPTFITGAMPDKAGCLALASAISGVDTRRGALVQSCLQETATAAAKNIGHVCVLISEQRFERPEGAVEQDWAVRVLHAYRRGIEVTRDDLEHLYNLEKITWAPTSERSRKQAGF